MPKLQTSPKPEEQIRPDALVRTIKQEKTPGGDKLKDIPVTPENYKKFQGEKLPRAKLPHGLVWGIVGIAALFVIGSTISFYIAKQKVKESVAAQAAALKAGVADLQNLDTQSAAQEFASLSGSSSTPTFGAVLGFFSSLFAGGKNAVGSFSDLASQLTRLSQEASALGDGVFRFTVAGASGANGSGDLVARLTDIRDTLAIIDADSNQLSGALSAVGASSLLGSNGDTSGNGDSYLSLKARVEGAENFLNTFIPWLASPVPHHLLVLLQNPSEMRPGGGFLGSYADVTIASGTIANVAIHDIADVDTGFVPKIIPPKPLQLEVKNFRPADGNWFLDFPTSASKTIQLFEAAQLYAGSDKASSTAFDGTVAISPKVVSDLLSVTGPVTVTSTTFTSDNLLVQIQNIVQKGQAQQNQTQSATYPKAVLAALSNKILTQLASSTDAQKQELFAMAVSWVAKREVMAYFRDPTLEGFVGSYGMAGDIYQLPQNYNGDYLSIADANIRGDKSDLYIAQNISLISQIGADGTITDTLKISRAHNGNQSPYWWYQTTNQDYLQIFVPAGSAFMSETGGVTKTITAPIDYAKNHYSTDPTIAALASTTQSFLLYPAVTAHEEAGKEVLATWAITPKGKTTSLEFDYSHRAFTPPANGVAYQFVFDKQAGSNRSYDFEIDAPLGYVFQENGLASYEFTSDDPPGRLMVTLTLGKI